MKILFIKIFNFISYHRAVNLIKFYLGILINDPLKIIYIPLNILLIILFPLIIVFSKVSSCFLKPENSLRTKKVETIKGLVSIIIINYNSGEFLLKCIKSILKQNYKKYKIIIIDNASKDGSMESIVNKDRRMEIIYNNQNMGFSFAGNQGIKIAKGEYVLLLNFDILLDKDFLREMVKAINLKSNIGSISGKLLRNDKIIDSTGIIIKHLFAKDRGEEEKISNKKYNSGSYIFGPSGAAAFYKRKMLEDCSIYGEIFDEDFWMYFEDVDLAWRAQIKGWKSFYTPKAIAYHKRGVTRENNLIENEYYKLIGWANRILSFSKNLLFVLFIKNISALLKYQIRNFFYICINERFYFFALKYVWILKRLPNMFVKRKVIMKERKADIQYLNGLIFNL